MGDINAFRAALSVLFKPAECAVSLFGHQYLDRKKQHLEWAGEGDILWLEDVQDPETLDPFWTLSVPGWYSPDMGNLYTPSLGKENGGGPRVISQLVCLDGHTITEMDVYNKSSPFLIFEVDNLIIADKNKTTSEIKKLQRDMMAYAFQAAGFPFAVLTDSGGKSVHATVRLDDDLETVKAWRASPEFDRLLDLSAVVFGDYDMGVLEQSGCQRLVRTPGARRDDGSPQTIIATGQRTTIAALTQWFQSQLSPEAQKEIWSRAPIKDKISASRQRYLRLPQWRKDLMQAHEPGHRGRHWRDVSMSLMLSGSAEPQMVTKPSPNLPYGHWQASWLWHASAYVFNVYSSGWFFSHDVRDWEKDGERTRWDGASSRNTRLHKQLVFEKATDPTTNHWVDQMLATAAIPGHDDAVRASIQAQKDAQQIIAGLPPVPANMLPPPFVGGTTGATLATTPLVSPGAQNGEYSLLIDTFFTQTPKDTFFKLSQKQGDIWMLFDGKIWIDLPNDYARVFIANQTLPRGAEGKLVAEIYQAMLRECMLNTPWVENPNAIAFQNGTLYMHPDRVEFRPAHDPADRLRSLVPCNYDPAATCPQWESFTRWALPDTSRLSLLQEAFGYTLIPGQRYQSFFMFTGIGSNGKSVVLSILQALHKDSFEAVALANLGSRFSLGTLGRKRLAIDTEAENVTHQVLSDGNSALAILKAWTGGDPVKIEAKKVQGWSETINAKYFMACNRRPRFADPTKGVWRRLKLLKFESQIDGRQADGQLPHKLIAQELPGIVNWAIQGLARLVRQNGFTQSDLLMSDLSEYQTDSDSVAQFVVEFLRPAPADSTTAWFDLRPYHAAYKEYCGQIAVPPVGESEFRQRLGMLNVTVGRPSEQDPVQNCPAGFERMPGHQYWAIKGQRCYHPAYATQTLMGSYAGSAGKSQVPHFAQQGAR
jgi:putative DNA primase/helicase